jgi:hypothetical protein
MIDYDEEKVLCRYVLRWRPELMTDLERRAEHAAMNRSKAACAVRLGAHQQAKILLTAGCVGDAEINAALAEGHDAFRLRVVRRIQSDPSTAARINRCPRCRRVVRTPTAKQCLWCNHDWHDFNA